MYDGDAVMTKYAISSCKIEYAIRAVSIGIIACSLSFFLLNILANGSFINTYFVSDWHDTFMDYFNMLECVRKGDPYYAYANYPAIVFLIIKILFQFTPDSELIAFETAREEAFALRANMTAMLPFILLCLICLIVIAASARWMLRKYQRLTADFAVYAILLSGPMLFLLERGNMLLLSFACLMGFMALYRSEKSWVRAISCFLLALSAAMKLYPAIFALLLLSDRKYKEFFLTVAFGLILLIAPFFVFGGISSIGSMLRGFTLSGDFASSAGFGSNFSLKNLIRIMGSVGHVEIGVPTAFFSVLALGFSLVLFFVSQSRWMKVFACALACIWVPSFSYTYTLTLIIPVILTFCEDIYVADSFEKIVIVFLTATLAMPITPEIIPSDRFSLYGWCLITNLIICIVSIALFLNQFYRLKKVI